MERTANGTIAYDFSRFESGIGSAAGAGSGALPRRRAAEDSAAAKSRYERPVIAKNRKLGISLFAATLFIIISALFIMVVASHMQLNELSIENASLSKQISSIQKTNDELAAKYDGVVFKKMIEDRARELGMGYPSEEQVIFIRVAGEDTVTIFDEQQSVAENIWKQLEDEIRGFFESLV